MTNRSEEIAKLTGEIIEKLWETLAPYSDLEAGQAELYPCLIASAMVVEAFKLRLRNMGVQEEMIDLALERAQEQVDELTNSQDRLFPMKGEEV